MIKRFWKSLKSGNKAQTAPVIQNSGHCPTCDQDVTFIAHNERLRDYYLCSNCSSIPRERALMLTIEQYFPSWRNAIIHESSPGNRGVSRRLSEECSHYIPSHYFPNQKLGSIVDSFRCENLETLTFADECIDLHVTQDVLEHVFHPCRYRLLNSGLTIPPWGVPACGYCTVPDSITPALIHLPSTRRITPSRTRWSRMVRSC